MKDITAHITYRVEVQRLIEVNSSQYPTTNELIALTKMQGQIALFLLAANLAEIMDGCFADGISAAACAMMIEQTSAAAKAKAMQQVEEEKALAAAEAALLEKIEI